MSNTLIVQFLDIIGKLLIFNWTTLIASSPTNEVVCIIFVIFNSYLALFHTFFLLLTVLTKYGSVFYSTYQDMLPEDGKMIKAMWIFVIIASTLLNFLEFSFVNEFEDMNTFKALRVRKNV